MVFPARFLFQQMKFKAPRSRLFKRLQMKRLAAKFTGRSWNCYTLGIRLVNKALQYSTKELERKPVALARLYETRLEAACLEHNMDKRYFLTSLAEHDINLNRETLANMAIYEPRTFQSMVEFVKARASESGLQSGVINSTQGTEIRGIQDKVKKASS